MRATPTKLKELKGSKNVTKEAKRRNGGEEVSFSPVESIPAPPAYFGEIATYEWNTLLPELKTKGLLEVVDLPQLRLYCFNIQIAEECAEQLKSGITQTITNQGGYSYETESPHIKIMNNATAIVKGIASKFGFDPVARTKVATPTKAKEKEKDAFDLALEGKMKIAK